MFLNKQHKVEYAFVAACALVLSAVSSSIACELESDAKKHALSLDYDAFDQSTSDSPWRNFVSEGECYEEAAQLIEYYLSNSERLRDDQVRNLNFHAGQMYAISGNTERAIKSFKKSLWAEQPDDFPINWNAYVRGTLAYLMRDKSEFDDVLDAFRREPTDADDPDLMNYRLLQKMGKCWGGHYHDIIKGACSVQ